jgi:hypothetical protein
VPLAFTTVAVLTTAPDVGKPMADAGTSAPANCAQASGKTLGAGVPGVPVSVPPVPLSPPATGSSLPPPHAASDIANTVAQASVFAALEFFMLSPLLLNAGQIDSGTAKLEFFYEAVPAVGACRHYN